MPGGPEAVDEGDFTVVADLPKRVDWEQDRVAESVDRIRNSGDDPARFVDIAIKERERKYAACLDNIGLCSSPGRTVRTGALRVGLLSQGCAARAFVLSPPTSGCAMLRLNTQEARSSGGRAERQNSRGPRLYQSTGSSKEATQRDGPRNGVSGAFVRDWAIQP